MSKMHENMCCEKSNLITVSVKTIPNQYKSICPIDSRSIGFAWLRSRGIKGGHAWLSSQSGGRARDFREITY